MPAMRINETDFILELGEKSSISLHEEASRLEITQRRYLLSNFNWSRRRYDDFIVEKETLVDSIDDAFV